MKVRVYKDFVDLFGFTGCRPNGQIFQYAKDRGLKHVCDLVFEIVDRELFNSSMADFEVIPNMDDFDKVIAEGKRYAEGR